MTRLRLAAALALWGGLAAAAPASAQGVGREDLAGACPRFQLIWGVPERPIIPARRFCACMADQVRRLSEAYPDMPVTAAALNFSALDPVSAQTAEEAYGSGAPAALLSRRVYGFAVLSAAAEACAPPLGEEAGHGALSEEEDPPEGFEPPSEDEAP